ncbi:pentatricopeptide repeat-containing protein, mitochondrial-like [Cocos nucifera]|uniref:Pentatricopeptide repeat-containing protein, mitochondrial-like n=1 Tax=Cocos nucifera TaxID=13894 RepID=A0A8K0HVZ2_COCNU|nr:pentatricopeptide repeat-containing protein, mitochondrial-like [Cocos nucifera]
MGLLSPPISCINQPLPFLTPRQSPRAQPTVPVRNPWPNSDSQDDPNAPHLMFDRMPDRQSCASPSSTSLIVAHTKRGDFSRAFELFIKMSRSGGTPDEFALGSLLKASSGLSDVSLGEQLHAKSIRAGLASEPGVRTSLITLYSSNDLLEEARQVFDEVRLDHEAMLEQAQLNPSDATYAIMINACTSSKEDAKKVFKAMDWTNVVSWNAMISGLEQNGECENSIQLFRRLTVFEGREVHAKMIRSGLEFETSIGNSLITMYGKSGEVAKGREMQSQGNEPDIHTLIILLGGLSSDLSVATSCRLGDAEKVFKGMDEQDTYTWNAMIDGYSTNGYFDDALTFFIDMHKQGLVEEGMHYFALMRKESDTKPSIEHYACMSSFGKRPFDVQVR